MTESHFVFPEENICITGRAKICSLIIIIIIVILVIIEIMSHLDNPGTRYLSDCCQDAPDTCSRILYTHCVRCKSKDIPATGRGGL
jgi:hypothetical protein